MHCAASESLRARGFYCSCTRNTPIRLSARNWRMANNGSTYAYTWLSCHRRAFVRWCPQLRECRACLGRFAFFSSRRVQMFGAVVLAPPRRERRTGLTQRAHLDSRTIDAARLATRFAPPSPCADYRTLPLSLQCAAETCPPETSKLCRHQRKQPQRAQVAQRLRP